MHATAWTRHALGLLALAGFFTAPSRAAEPARIDYLRDVKPILLSRCCSCHGALRQKAGLRLDTAALVRKGGDTGPALVPHNSGDSLLIDAITGNGRTRMPPKNEAPALTEMEIALFKSWIDQGATAPPEATPEDPRKHWAFRPPVRPVSPVVGNLDWTRNPIDAFIAAEHHKQKLRPVSPASKATLLRRVSLDLTGLPPTRDELHAFLDDPSPDAYEKVVDRLLASPRYGERWARHWMDVWRYSDWYGRRAVPDVWNSAPQVWRWRDWIVRSLNADKGYDRMVQEMLAGDEIAPGDDEVGVATGFLVRNWYALNPNQWMRDNVEHTGKAFLGLTFNCAHCHDHKYDPISQEEYFRFRAFFETIDVRQDRWQGEADPGPFQKYDYSVLRRVVGLGSVRVFDAHPEAKTFLYFQGDERNRLAGKAPVTPGAPAFLDGERLKIEKVALPPVASYPGLKPWLQQAELERHEQAGQDARAGLEKAQYSLAFARGQLALLNSTFFDPKRPLPPVVVDARQWTPQLVQAAERALALAEARLARAGAERLAIQARLTADRIRYLHAPGNADEAARTASKAERLAAVRIQEEQLLLAEPLTGPQGEARRASIRPVLAKARQALQDNDSKYTPLTPTYPSTSTGRRLALARWLTRRDNPLTARVAVNHIWMRHFDRPLVETVHDFGRNGKPPSHPELLDFLAVELMDSGWSMKKLHRMIVTSRTYRLQSGAGESSNPSLAHDSDNRWLWHYPVRRLEAEVVRDSLLQAAGELDPTLGGPVLETGQEATSRRRSLYFTIHPEEGGHLKFLELFDAPDPCECYRRTATVLPQQALGLTNSSLVLEMSQALARKLWGQGTGGHEAFVLAAFEQVLSRRPAEREMSLCLDYLHRQAELVRKSGRAADADSRARESLIRVLFNHDDFVTLR